MAIYRELFFNNLKSLLSNMFPVLTKLHSDQHWRRLVRRFMQHHQAHTPRCAVPDQQDGGLRSVQIGDPLEEAQQAEVAPVADLLGQVYQRLGRLDPVLDGPDPAALLPDEHAPVLGEGQAHGLI